MVDYFILLLGAMGLVQGVPYLLSPAYVRKRARKAIKADDNTHRFAGVIMTVIALAIVTIAL